MKTASQIFAENWAASYGLAVRRATPGMRVWRKGVLLQMPGYAYAGHARGLVVQWWREGRCQAEQNFCMN